jgi:bifunctional non-homologous end joining protein LigD
MSLVTYRKKRRFGRTPEPAGKRVTRRSGGPLRYVMHKHDATRLHFDLRLEHSGVLLSWAVPKGAPLVAGGKALAVRTEDHPLEYGAFEGVIPEGEYGAGTVMLWDHGTWEPEKTPARGLADGELTFTLRGTKLRGRWTLVRTAGVPKGSGKEGWLLIKRSDPRGAVQSVLGEPELSASTGRTMAEIAASSDRTWSSTAGEVPRRKKAVDSVSDLCSKVRGARKAAQPKRLRPELPTLADAVPEGDEWLHEIELVGERILAFKEGKHVTLRSREGRDRTRELAPVAEAVRGFPAERAVLDGEAVVLDADGRSDAAGLRSALARRGKSAAFSYFVFDLPACGGYDLTRAALADRKALLLRLFAIVGHDPVLRFADHIAGRGAQVLREACQMGLEGIVSKRADAPYVQGRSRAWVEVKCARAGLVPDERGKGGRDERARGNGRHEARAPARRAARGPAVVEVEGVRITHPDRMLYAEHGLTKADVARYCSTVARFLLPHVVERPLTLVRCPEGPTGACFYQKHARPGMPEAIRRIRIAEQDDSGIYVYVSDVEGLLSLVQFGVIEIHPWGSRVDKLDHPDRIVIDLDPDPRVPWREVVSTARAVRDMLTELGLEGFPRTTGGKGLHVVLPIERRSPWPEVKAFARNLVALLVRAAPSKYVLTASKAQRKGRIFLDYLRNDRGSTAIASYCMRARPGAPVATPLRWEELSDALDPTSFTIPTVTERLARLRSDPWQRFFEVRQSLTRAMQSAVR